MTVSTGKRVTKGRRSYEALRYGLQTLLRVLPMRQEGLTLAACCERLNADGWLTFSGRLWTVGRLSQVVSLARRALNETLNEALEEED